MSKIPRINNLDSEGVLRKRGGYMAPFVETDYGNLYYMWYAIEIRATQLNKQIERLNRLHKRFMNIIDSKGQCVNDNDFWKYKVKYLTQQEIVAHYMKNLVDKIVGYSCLVYKANHNEEFGNYFSIGDILKGGIDSDFAQFMRISEYKVLLETINDVDNGLKHSFVNLQNFRIVTGINRNCSISIDYWKYNNTDSASRRVISMDFVLIVRELNSYIKQLKSDLQGLGS